MFFEEIQWFCQDFKSENLYFLNVYFVHAARILDLSLHQKWSFSLRISSVNVTKFEVSCGFGHIYGEILNGKLQF